MVLRLMGSAFSLEAAPREGPKSDSSHAHKLQFHHDVMLGCYSSSFSSRLM